MRRSGLGLCQGQDRYPSRSKCKSAWVMNERPTINGRPASRREPAVSRVAYVTFCGGISIAVLFLTFSSLFLPKRSFPTAGEQHGAKIPVARIQFTPDQKCQ